MNGFALACPLALLLVACNYTPQAGNQQSVTEKSAAASAVPNDNPASGSPSEKDTNEARAAPLSSAVASKASANRSIPSFIGLWATARSNCSAKPWRFTAHQLNVPGGPSCTFYQVSQKPGGYDLAAQCPTKKPVPTDLIKVRFGQFAGQMLVESNALPPTGLIACDK